MFRPGLAAVGVLGILIMGPSAAAPQSPAAKSYLLQSDTKAIDLVRAVSKRLAAARTLSFVADETIKTLSGPDTPQVQRHRSRVTLERPEKLRVVLSGGGV